MKAVLLVLSGDANRARAWLEAQFPDISIEFLSRYDLENQSPAQRLRVLRQLQPDIFTIVTERLAWQRGQNALLAFAAVAGASRVVLIDSRGAVREESRAKILSRTPARLARESAASAAAIRRSRSDLKRLEREISTRPVVRINQ